MGSKSHQCSICQKVFARPSKLQYHIAYHHEKKFSFECRLCGKAYSNQDHVNRHYRTVHEQQNKINTIKLMCTIDECQKTFVNRQNLHRHIRTIHQAKENKLVKCFYCEKSVPSLESHLISNHQSISIDQLRCLDCSKEFSSVKRLIHHRIIHSDQRREVDVQSTINYLLDRIEREEQVYPCDLCDRTFRSLLQLDQHRHSKAHQQFFVCSYPSCEKRFVHMRNLRHHIKIHHEESSRCSCVIERCPKTFTSQASLIRHLRRCHSSEDVQQQLGKKNKRSIHRQSSIPSFLSGFNHRKLHSDHRLAEKFHQLVTNDIRVDFTEDSRETTSNVDDDEKLNSILLEGYQEMGMMEL